MFWLFACKCYPIYQGSKNYWNIQYVWQLTSTRFTFNGCLLKLYVYLRFPTIHHICNKKLKASCWFINLSLPCKHILEQNSVARIRDASSINSHRERICCPYIWRIIAFTLLSLMHNLNISQIIELLKFSAVKRKMWELIMMLLNQQIHHTTYI